MNRTNTLGMTSRASRHVWWGHLAFPQCSPHQPRSWRSKPKCPRRLWSTPPLASMKDETCGFTSQAKRDPNKPLDSEKNGRYWFPMKNSGSYGSVPARPLKRLLNLIIILLLIIACFFKKARNNMFWIRSNHSKSPNTFEAFWPPCHSHLRHQETCGPEAGAQVVLGHLRCEGAILRAFFWWPRWIRRHSAITFQASIDHGLFIDDLDISRIFQDNMVTSRATCRRLWKTFSNMWI